MAEIRSAPGEKVTQKEWERIFGDGEDYLEAYLERVRKRFDEMKAAEKGPDGGRVENEVK